jgi:GH15 family glucan-1,4-alpha-glucosidase
VKLEELGLIGNCQYAALVHRSGDVAFCCMPRFDSPPLFASLIDADSDDAGRFWIRPASGELGEQSYIDNTNVLETRFSSPDGVFRVIDFAPRFQGPGRMFRPTKLVRIIEPLSGTPLIRVTCDPRLGWSKEQPRAAQGSNHTSYHGYGAEVRLTSDVPMAYLQGLPFALTERKYMVLSWEEPVEESLPLLCERFLTETLRYWQSWVKHCDVPARYQAEVIRSALALKLHCYEDTGAIVAAITTSIPEHHGSGRNWDYRYCWLRDAFYTLDAFRKLGHFEERERFTHFLLTVTAGSPNLELAPLYRIDGTSDLTEEILPHWRGFMGDGPVRIGNGAALHQQHDVYGELVLALAPVFMDARFRSDQTKPTLDLIMRLAERARAVMGTPDAGIWEVRKSWEVQTFSSVMCWAALDRAAKVAERHAGHLYPELRGHADAARVEILARAWDPRQNALVSTYGGTDLDASLLQAITLRLLEPRSSEAHGTIDAVKSALGIDPWLMRYRTDDGLGVPTAAFVICTFWLVEALALSGRAEEARHALDRICALIPPLGLLAEDWNTAERRMWGNFPQAYSHVGLIHAAFAASPPWSEVL